MLFGDVWVCSGQSNMAYSLSGSNGVGMVHPPVNDSQKEIRDMTSYPFVRLYRAGQQASQTPKKELLPPKGPSVKLTQGWSEPCPVVDGHRACRADFSSVCWFYGRDIFTLLKQQGQPRPIGLIGSDGLSGEKL